MWLPRLAPSILVSACLASATIGCGGSVASDSSPSAGDYTLDDVCTIVPPKLCAIEKPCCESSGVGYDEQGCLAKQTADCEADIAEVRAGTMAFDASGLDACLADLATVWNECRPGFPDYVGLATTKNLCATVWRGKVGPGASCKRDEQCKPPPDPNAFASCTGGTCTTMTLLDEGASCSIGGSPPTLCGSGLYCDTQALAPATGTCKRATSVGGACSTAKAIDLSCGLGNYCDPSAAICTAGKTAGAACSQSTFLECASLTCASGRCAPLPSLASETVCKGAGATDAGAD